MTCTLPPGSDKTHRPGNEFPQAEPRETPRVPPAHSASSTVNQVRTRRARGATRCALDGPGAQPGAHSTGPGRNQVRTRRALGGLGGGGVGGWPVAALEPVLAQSAELGVGRLAHQGHQLVAVAQVDGFFAHVRLGVGGAVPVEVVAAGAPCGSLVLANDDLEVLGAVGAFDVAVGAPDRQLPADVWLGRDDADSAVESQLVQRASGAGGKSGAVEEDAAAVDDARLATALVVLLRDLLGAVELPVVRAAAPWPTSSRASRRPCRRSVRRGCSSRRRGGRRRCPCTRTRRCTSSCWSAR